ncbi:aldo/keto reductase [Halorubrum distributum]|uniref:Aldo/keto reductase n=1 Tax=Halorubrum distributum JCM 10247 TaxID=1227486 RepID=M0DMS0_9EURY|nr:aldo/keto reductase [Halorubrum terrestre]ELZ35444.1 aldo/keto reductase [Halorubrum terrestre JCM 10247]
MASNTTSGSETFEIGGELTVNRLGFGAMRITGEEIIGRPEDEADAKDVLRRAVELGVDFVDTADSYGPGVSERLIGEALGDPGDVVVASKAGLLRNREGEWLPHGDPDFLKNQVLCSLDRLGTDTIDLYQYHRPDPDTDFEESVHAFAEMKDAGQIAHVGLSNVTVEQLETAMEIVDIATVQNRYNVGHRDDEDMLAACEDHGVGFIPWGPMYAVDDEDAGEVLDEVAERRDATPQQVSLAWLLDHSDVTLPIPGTSSVDHLESNLAAADLTLTDEDRAALNGVDPQ